MTQTIVNGAGMMKSLGIDDRSKRVLPITPEAIPQHLPLCFVFAERGSGRHLVDGSSRSVIFGDRTWDPRNLYFNHATAFANEFNAQGNACMVERLVPTDAGPKANAVLWLDILVTTVDRYRRNADGSIFLDSLGDSEITTTTPGLKAKWVKTNRTTVVDQQGFGNKTNAVGDQMDIGTNTQSVRYPIFEIEETSYGSGGNNTGFRFWAATTEAGGSVPTQMMAKSKAYPYYWSVVERDDPLSTPIYNKTINDETRVLFTFKKNVVNPTTSQKLSYDQVIVSSYNDVGRPNYPNVFGRLGKFYAYDAKIETVLQLMYQYETPFINDNSDITEDEDTYGLMNFATGTSSKGVPYESFVFVDSQTSVRMSESNSIFMAGGADGTMSKEMFETLFNAQMDRYANPNDVVQDLAYNVESYLYDSGFSLESKFKMPQFISLRKDTKLVMGTHIVGEPVMTESEEQSVAISLRTRLQMFPESVYFGTPTARAMIMGRSGIIVDNEYTERLPMTYEIANKFAVYMGASNGAWKSGASPEGSPGNVVRRMRDISIVNVPDSVRNRDWDLGLNWVLRSGRSGFFIPAYKTVYNDDTSTLNSMLVAAAAGQLTRYAFAAWVQLTGRSDLSEAQLAERTNSIVKALVTGKFDNRYTIIPAATFTKDDSARGFSWSFPIKIGAENARSVMITWVENFRKADLTNTTPNSEV